MTSIPETSHWNFFIEISFKTLLMYLSILLSLRNSHLLKHINLTNYFSISVINTFIILISRTLSPSDVNPAFTFNVNKYVSHKSEFWIYAKWVFASLNDWLGCVFPYNATCINWTKFANGIWLSLLLFWFNVPNLSFSFRS